jgi:2-keto-4-pentenoate hydratase/2-oxohepta-3-ene-1,7-dioic acid hydratase in catechol pathway
VTDVNGERRQRGNSKTMVFGCEQQKNGPAHAGPS